MLKKGLSVVALSTAIANCGAPGETSDISRSDVFVDEADSGSFDVAYDGDSADIANDIANEELGTDAIADVDSVEPEAMGTVRKTVRDDAMAVTLVNMPLGVGSALIVDDGNIIIPDVNGFMVCAVDVETGFTMLSRVDMADDLANTLGRPTKVIAVENLYFIAYENGIVEFDKDTQNFRSVVDFGSFDDDPVRYPLEMTYFVKEGVPYLFVTGLDDIKEVTDASIDRINARQAREELGTTAFVVNVETGEANFSGVIPGASHEEDSDSDLVSFVTGLPVADDLPAMIGNDFGYDSICKIDERGELACTSEDCNGDSTMGISEIPTQFALRFLAALGIDANKYEDGRIRSAITSQGGGLSVAMVNPGSGIEHVALNSDEDEGAVNIPGVPVNVYWGNTIVAENDDKIDLVVSAGILNRALRNAFAGFGVNSQPQVFLVTLGSDGNVEVRSTLSFVPAEERAIFATGVHSWHEVASGLVVGETYLPTDPNEPLDYYVAEVPEFRD